MMSYCVRLTPVRQRKIDPIKKLKRSLYWRGRYTNLKSVWQELRDNNRKMYIVLNNSIMWQVSIKSIYRFGCNVRR